MRTRKVVDGKVMFSYLPEQGEDQIEVTFWNSMNKERQRYILRQFKPNFRKIVRYILQYKITYLDSDNLTENIKAYCLMLGAQAFELCCNTNHCHELLQVFADGDFKNEIERLIFEMVV